MCEQICKSTVVYFSIFELKNMLSLLGLQVVELIKISYLVHQSSLLCLSKEFHNFNFQSIIRQIAIEDAL